MEKSALAKVLIVVYSLLILALVLLLVPGTVAGDEPPATFVGVLDEVPPAGVCWMIDPEDGKNKPILDAEIWTAPPGSQLPQDTPVDVVALLKCKTTFPNPSGVASRFTGSSSFNCWAYLKDSPYSPAQTASWTQTVSASGESTLTCHFRGNIY